MATSIREYIIQNLQTAIRTVRKSNSYDNDIDSSSVYRAVASGDVTKFPSVYIYEADESIYGREINGSNTQVIKDMEVLIVVFISDYGALATEINSIEADVVKAVMVDSTRGGYAEYTEQVGSAPFLLDGISIGGRTISVNVRYAHKEIDPYTQ